MNLGFQELLVLFVIALLIFGPKRLPELARQLGQGIRDFKKAMAEGEEGPVAPPPEIKPPEEPGMPISLKKEEKDSNLSSLPDRSETT